MKTVPSTMLAALLTLSAPAFAGPPQPPPPGGCGGLDAKSPPPEIACEATATSVGCWLVTACMGQLQTASVAGSGYVETVTGQRVPMMPTGDGYGLSAPLQLGAGAFARVVLSPALKGAGGRAVTLRTAGRGPVRRVGQDSAVAVRVPGGDDQPVAVAPGKGIGPVQLGMTRARVEQLGLPVVAHGSGQLGDTVRMVGPYYVVFDAKGAVASIEMNLAESTGATVGATALEPGQSLEQIAKTLGSCGAVTAVEGGATAACAQGTLVVKAGAQYQPAMVELQVFPPKAAK